MNQEDFHKILNERFKKDSQATVWYDEHIIIDDTTFGWLIIYNRKNMRYRHREYEGEQRYLGAFDWLQMYKKEELEIPERWKV